MVESLNWGEESKSYALSESSLEEEDQTETEASGRHACPYCDVIISERELLSHLDNCEVYSNITEPFHTSFFGNRLYSALRDSRLQFLSGLPEIPRYTYESSDGSYSYSPSDTSEETKSPRNQDLSYGSETCSTPRLGGRRMNEVFKRSSRIMLQGLNSSSKKETGIRCPICFNDYNHSLNKPLVLSSCGHSVCEVCIVHIAENNRHVKCPVCRALNLQKVTQMPVNYALLDLVEKQNENRREECSKHNLEIVGYCKDDDLLLCGACVFEHKDHDAFSIHDKRAEEIADSYKSLISEKESEIKSLKAIWQERVQALNFCSSEINEMADKHISELRKEEASMIGEIKQGTDSCIKQIKSLLNNEKLKHLQATLTSNINKINSELSSLKQKRTKFKELSIPQKLQVTKLPSSIETEEPPSIEAATKLAKKLRVEVSYRDAIMKRKFPIL
jgi:hypothetical protein